jgi:hypothetical protein
LQTLAEAVNRAVDADAEGCAPMRGCFAHLAW